MEALTRNTQDSREYNRIRGEEELHEYSVLEGLAFLLRHKTCREWLWNLLFQLRLQNRTTALDHPNVDALSHYHQGMQNAADIIERQCKEADPDSYLLLIKEGMELERVFIGQQEPKKKRGGNRGRRQLQELQP